MKAHVRLFARARDLAGADARYAGLTPAQWACFGLLGMGVYFLWGALVTPGSAALPARRAP